MIYILELERGGGRMRGLRTGCKWGGNAKDVQIRRLERGKGMLADNK
jgi:hypothetical protein